MLPRKGEGERDAPTSSNGSEDIELRQRRNLETLGRLSGHVVHDFNNLLMVMDGYARMILEDPALSRFARENAEEILRAVERGAELTRQILDFARKPAGGPQVLDVKRQIEKLKPLLERLLGDSVRLEVDLPEIALWLVAERDQMEQVLLNLIVNARDAMPLGGRIRVAAEQSGNRVRIQVTDTGEGIAPEALPRVFEPYYTTKSSGKGTGIGLAMVQETISAWGGTVEVQSTLGEGARFTLDLPAADASSSQAPPAGHRGAILLAEDEPSLRTLIRRVLEQEGFQVIEAASEAEAIERAQSQPTLRLLITDLELAAGDGRRLAARLRTKPGLSGVIYISGYMQEVTPDDACYLQKPFSPSTLVLAVQKLLSA
jgi:CheY-like chemotaxis protein